MKQCQAGDGMIYAEIIVDYKKKDIKILNPEDRSKVKNLDLDLSITPMFIFVVIPFVLAVFISIFILGHLMSGIILIELSITFYLIPVLFPSIKRKAHKFWQWFANDFFKTKRLTIVKNIKTRVWKFPYDFENVKMDWDLYGDYKPYLRKVHIKPKDYFLVRSRDKKTNKWKNKSKQHSEWEAFFYFSRIPKKGRMEIVWI